MTFLLPCLTILITDTNWIQRLQLQLSVLIYFSTREIDIQPWTITRNELYRVYPFSNHCYDRIPTEYLLRLQLQLSAVYFSTHKIDVQSGPRETKYIQSTSTCYIII